MKRGGAIFLTQLPHTDKIVGRQELVHIYLEPVSKKFVCNHEQKQADNVYTTNYRNLLLWKPVQFTVAVNTTMYGMYSYALNC